MHEIIKSVGIDIGTSTTQLIFSELTIENEASNYVVPRINIVDKKVTYRSKIYFTPLLDQKTIDAEKVKEIIEKEYQDAGMKPEDLSTGAVIITGETACQCSTGYIKQPCRRFCRCNGRTGSGICSLSERCRCR